LGFDPVGYVFPFLCNGYLFLWFWCFSFGWLGGGGGFDPQPMGGGGGFFFLGVTTTPPNGENPLCVLGGFFLGCVVGWKTKQKTKKKTKKKGVLAPPPPPPPLFFFTPHPTTPPLFFSHTPPTPHFLLWGVGGPCLRFQIFVLVPGILGGQTLGQAPPPPENPNNPPTPPPPPPKTPHVFFFFFGVGVFLIIPSFGFLFLSLKDFPPKTTPWCLFFFGGELFWVWQSLLFWVRPHFFFWGVGLKGVDWFPGEFPRRDGFFSRSAFGGWFWGGPVGSGARFFLLIPKQGLKRVLT